MCERAARIPLFDFSKEKEITDKSVSILRDQGTISDIDTDHTLSQPCTIDALSHFLAYAPTPGQTYTVYSTFRVELGQFR